MTIEDVAKDYVKQLIEKTGAELDNDACDLLREVFTAGARFMSRLGETHKTTIYGCGDEMQAELCINPDKFKVGDEVIVQIRKA